MRTLRYLYILTLACAALPLSGCVGGSTSSGGGSSNLSVEQQVQQHDMQLRQMQPAQAAFCQPPPNARYSATLACRRASLSWTMSLRAAYSVRWASSRSSMPFWMTSV